MGEYSFDRKWSDIMIPQIKRLVGPWLLEESSFENDAQQATDLMILNARDKRIAARVRRPGYADRYPYEFTIRSQRDSGSKTELEKIINGFGDWMFYGHASSDNLICRWWLIDLNSFRAGLIRDKAKLKFERRSNGDGTHFYAFDLRSFSISPPILISGSHIFCSKDIAA
jgi:hypothetical protein